MKNIAFVASILVSSAVSCLAVTPAFSQLGGEGYSSSGGSARVVNQSAKAYRMPGATSISTGTMSKSAQGINQSGERINQGLPTVHWGSTVTTCGDHQYSTGFISDRSRNLDVPNVAGTVQVNTKLPGVNWGGAVGTAGDGMRSDFHPERNSANQSWWRARQGGPVVVTKSTPWWTQQSQSTASYGGASAGGGTGGAGYGSALSY